MSGVGVTVAGALLLRARAAERSAAAVLTAAADCSAFSAAALRACFSASICANASGATVAASNPPSVASASARSGETIGVVSAPVDGVTVTGAGCCTGSGDATGDCIGMSDGSITV